MPQYAFPSNSLRQCSEIGTNQLVTAQAHLIPKSWTAKDQGMQRAHKAQAECQLLKHPLSPDV